MFHRVKPETQPEAQNSPAQSPQERRPESRNDAAQAFRTQERPQQEPAASPYQKETTNREEKDQQPMNQQDQTTDERNEQQTRTAQQSRPLDIPAGAYGRTTTAPRPGTPGYPGASYPGASYASQRSSTEKDPERDSMLTIGPGITMSGEIEACDYLVVEGTVEAALKGARVLEVEEGGVFYGAVEIEQATIAGRFEGDITVRGRLTIRSSGTITGSIAYGELEVEAGATIDGRLTPVKALQDGTSSEKQSNNKARGQQASAKARTARADQQQSPANTDGELFSNKTAAAE